MGNNLKIGLLFSGQGAQKTGMGQTLYTQNSVYRSVIDQASETLELDLPHLYFDADAESTLNETQYTQPAIVAMSLAIFETIKAQLPEIAGGIGLSLGEYSALAASGYLSVDAALRLVKTRGALMQRASDLKPSKMVAVMNTPVSLIEEACAAGSSEGTVAIANINTPKQVVIGGDVTAVDAAMAFLTAHDVSRTVTLNVSGAFHTPLMKPAQAKLNQALATVNWQSGQFPVISTTTGQAFKPETLTTTLTDQLISPTRFVTAIEALGQQVDAVIELGPGKTLMSFARKTVKGIDYYHIEDIDTLTETISKLRGE